LNSDKNQGGNKTKLDLKTAFYFVKIEPSFSEKLSVNNTEFTKGIL